MPAVVHPRGEAHAHLAHHLREEVQRLHCRGYRLRRKVRPRLHGDTSLPADLTLIRAQVNVAFQELSQEPLTADTVEKGSDALRAGRVLAGARRISVEIAYAYLICAIAVLNFNPHTPRQTMAPGGRTVRRRHLGARNRPMPRYFFHVEDGEFTRDTVGLELTDDAAARTEAVQRSGRYLADRPQEVWETRRWRLLVAPYGMPALFGLEVTPVDGRHLVPWQHE